MEDKFKVAPLPDGILIDPVPEGKPPLSMDDVLAQIVALSGPGLDFDPTYIDIGTSQVAYVRLRSLVAVWSCGVEVQTVTTAGKTHLIESYEFPCGVHRESEGWVHGVLPRGDSRVPELVIREAVSDTARKVSAFLSHFYSRLLRVTG